MSRADKYIIHDNTPYWSSEDLHPVHDTGPVAIWISDVVANVHMHQVLRSHKPASLTGRMVRRNRSLLSWACAWLTVSLIGLTVIGFIYTGIAGAR